MSEPSSSTESVTETTETPPTETTETTTPPTPPEPKSIINEEEPAEPAPPAKPEGAPEAYADFTLPEGVKLNEEAFTKATELFKTTGLSQTQAQAFVDYHVAELARVREAADTEGEATFRETVNEWGTKLKADPDIGAKLPAVKADLGRMYDSLINAVPEKATEARALVDEFKTTLDLTGIGNHPAFVKVFHRLAQMVIEPGHVSGKGPATRNADGSLATGNPGLAASMYPPKS
jgi:hypothetical protein